MKTIYNNYEFQEIHCSEGNLIKSNIDNLIHCCKLVNSPLNNLFYCETNWGYSFPTTNCGKDLYKRWKEWSNYCFSKSIVAEIIKIPPFVSIDNLDKSIFQELHVVSKTCALNISDENFISNFKKKTRYIIKKADKSLVCKVGNKKDAIEIYELYKKSMKNLNADKRFLLNLKTFQFLLNNQNSSIHLAYFEDKIVGFVCFLFDSFISHYHLSASNEIGKKLNVNYLLLYKAISESVKKGIKLIHYGGGLTNKVDDPLFKFKSKFSNSILDYRIGLSIHNQELFKQYRNTKSNKIIDFVEI